MANTSCSSDPILSERQVGRGVGFYFRNVTELVLFGIRGKLRTLKPGRTQTNIIIEQKRAHPIKPDSVFNIIESCSPGPYIELFARFKRRGWAHWGDETALNGEHIKMHPMYRGNGILHERKRRRESSKEILLYA